MHPERSFIVESREMQDELITAVGFGMVFAQTPSGPRVAHTPLVPAEDGSVHFHLSNRNAIVPALDGGEALIVVNGPHAYISPRWYEDRGQVPTWNYLTVELEGRVRKLSPEGLADLLGTIGGREEYRIGGEDRWRPDNVPPERWMEQFRAITGFALEVTARRATFKLSQNKPAETRERIADALDAEGSPAMAALIRRFGEGPAPE